MRSFPERLGLKASKKKKSEYQASSAKGFIHTILLGISARLQEGDLSLIGQVGLVAHENNDSFCVRERTCVVQPRGDVMEGVAAAATNERPSPTGTSGSVN
jgi:hypothetical protein